MTTAERFGHNLAEARKQARLTQAQLSKRVPMSQQALSRLERGRHCPHLETLRRIAHALEVPVVDLLRGIE